MIWILKDGDEEVGFHYDLQTLIEISNTLKPKKEFKIECSYEDFNSEAVREVIFVPKCSKKNTEK